MFPLLLFISVLFICNGKENNENDTTATDETFNPIAIGKTEEDHTSEQVANNTITEEENFQFPEPHLEVEIMVEAAKDFVRRYLTAKKWHALKRLLQTVRDIGGTRRDGWRTVSVFLARVLTSDQKKEIMSRKEELFKTFGREIGIGNNDFH